MGERLLAQRVGPWWKREHASAGPGLQRVEPGAAMGAGPAAPRRSCCPGSSADLRFGSSTPRRSSRTSPPLKPVTSRIGGPPERRDSDALAVGHLRRVPRKRGSTPSALRRPPAAEGGKALEALARGGGPSPEPRAMITATMGISAAR